MNNLFKQFGSILRIGTLIKHTNNAYFSQLMQHKLAQELNCVQNEGLNFHLIVESFSV